MRRKVPLPEFSGAEPPAELLRYSVAQHVAGNYAGFEEWLSARRRWRATHDRPLPGLYARDRHALHSMTELDLQLVRDELATPRAEPDWVERARANQFSQRRYVGSLPAVALPVDAPGDTRQGVSE